MKNMHICAPPVQYHTCPAYIASDALACPHKFKKPFKGSTNYWVPDMNYSSSIGFSPMYCFDGTRAMEEYSIDKGQIFFSL